MKTYCNSLIDGTWNDTASYPLWIRMLYFIDYSIFRCRWIGFCNWVDSLQWVHRQNQKYVVPFKIPCEECGHEMGWHTNGKWAECVHKNPRSGRQCNCSCGNNIGR